MMQMLKCGGRLIENNSKQLDNSSVSQQLQSLLTVLVGIIQKLGILANYEDGCIIRKRDG